MSKSFKEKIYNIYNVVSLKQILQQSNLIYFWLEGPLSKVLQNLRIIEFFALFYLWFFLRKKTIANIKGSIVIFIIHLRQPVKICEKIFKIQKNYSEISWSFGSNLLSFKCLLTYFLLIITGILCSVNISSRWPFTSLCFLFSAIMLDFQGIAKYFLVTECYYRVMYAF